MAGEPSDSDLVREVLAGNVDRFEVLVRRYQRLVAAAALRMGTSRDEVEDVTSEVFYKVYRSLGRYRPEHAMSTWIYRISVNAALDRRRTRRQMGRQEEIPMHLADTRPSPLERAGEDERAGLVQQAVGRLPDHYRVPLVMVHAEGLGLDEVARVLGLPEGTVKSRLFRARAMLKLIIQRHYPALQPSAAGEEVL